MQPLLVITDNADGSHSPDIDSIEEYFSEAFAKTADRTMQVTPTAASRIPFIVAGVVVIAALIIAYNTYRKRLQREKKKVEETQWILDTPIDQL